ncbi:MAG: ACT domain-containing protein, partial [Desulfobacterales bacterium]
MQAEQISIFIENKAGRLSDVTGILADSGINI